MKSLLLALRIGAGLLTAATPFTARKAPQLSATATSVTTADIAAALGQHWWSFELQLQKPIGEISVGLVELRRQADGHWEHSPLAPAQGYAHSPPDIESIELKVMIPDDPSQGFVLKLGANYFPSRFVTTPDLSHMWGTVDAAEFVDGCLVLKSESKDPHTFTGRDEDLVRVIGLQIETDSLHLPDR